MNLQWDGKVGPAAIIGMVGTLMTLVSLGVVWGTTTSKIDAAAVKAEDVKIELATHSNALARFQSDVINEVKNIGSKIDVTVGRLAAHEESDRSLRQSDTETVKSFERRLLTIERSNTRSGMNIIPEGPPSILRKDSRDN